MGSIKVFFRSSILLFLIIFSFESFSQASNPLTTEFLEGLPPSVREELTLNNAVKKEEELEKLFRADTEFDKTKDVLEKIRYELKAIESRLSRSDKSNEVGLKRFGDSFFSTIQSSFMPVNVPSAAGEYVVDVGDTLTIMLTGGGSSSISNDKPQMVQRDGTILLSKIGKLRVAGMTLDDVESAVEEYLNQTSPGVTSFITLSKLRDIQVVMIGGILSPGIFTLSGGSNVLTAINAAGGLSENGSYRQIEHKRNGETIQMIDLYEIFVNGNISFENSLRSGDVLLVHPITTSIPVSGGVNTEAIFELLPGESARDLVNYAGGFSTAFAGHDMIFVQRNQLESKEIIDVSVNNIDSFEMQPRDVVLVPAYANILEPAKQVVIEGFVERPGKYFISENERLSSIIKRAGGYKHNAYEFGGALFRQQALDVEQQFAQLSYFDTINFIISNIAQPGISASPDVIALLTEELRSRQSTGRVITEFHLNELSKNPSLDIILDDKDRIVIPPLQKVVYLFGDFKKPVNIGFDPDLSIRDYIKMAGGLNDSAQKELIVIDPSGSSRLYKKGFFASNKVNIYPGSVIYAPRDIAKVDGIRYAASIAPILSSLAITLASLNSIDD